MGGRLKETWALLNRLELRIGFKIDVGQTWRMTCLFHQRADELGFHLPRLIDIDLEPIRNSRRLSFASAQVSLNRLPISRQAS